jgi:hypothetical protein
VPSRADAPGDLNLLLGVSQHISPENCVVIDFSTEQREEPICRIDNISEKSHIKKVTATLPSDTYSD